MGSTVFTIGHSNQSLAAFIALLKRYQIDVLVDVRSQPYSKYATQFDAEGLKAALIAEGIKYLFLGKELGGRPAGMQFYDAAGYVRYDRLAQSALFTEGLSRVEKGASQYRLAIMCSEENPAECHRHLLLGRVLEERGLAVSHIRGDGSAQADAELRIEAQPMLPLFDDLNQRPWRSVHPVAGEASKDEPAEK